MDEPLTLTLHLQGGDKTYAQAKVPMQRALDAANMLDSLGVGAEYSWAKAITKKAEFVASVFEDKEITKKAILDNMNYSDQEQLDEIISRILTGRAKNLTAAEKE